MKKIIIGTLVLFGLVAVPAAFAETNGTVTRSISDADSSIEHLVERVLELDEEGYSKDEIIKMMLVEKKELADKYVEKKEYTLDNINFGQYKKSLRSGDYGDEVKQIQEKINELAEKLGLEKIEADGKFGPATARAVKLFQAQQGLSADGVIGPKTLAKLATHYSDKEDYNQKEILAKKEVYKKLQDKKEYTKKESDDGSSVESIKLEAELEDDGIKLEWDVEGESQNGFKIVKSKESNPVYPGDDYKYFSDEDTDEYTWNVSGSYHFRVCEYLGNGTCGVYSNDVFVEMES